MEYEFAGGMKSLKTPREKAALPAATQKKPCCLKVIKKQRVTLVQEKSHQKRKSATMKAKKIYSRKKEIKKELKNKQKHEKF